MGSESQLAKLLTMQGWERSNRIDRKHYIVKRFTDNVNGNSTTYFTRVTVDDPQHNLNFVTNVKNIIQTSANGLCVPHKDDLMQVRIQRNTVVLSDITHIVF